MANWTDCPNKFQEAERLEAGKQSQESDPEGTPPLRV